MRPMRRGTLLALLLALVSGLLIGVGPGQALTSRVPATDYDTFEDWTFNDVVGGVEQPYTGTSVVVYQTPEFDTQDYSVVGAETAAGSANRNGCLVAPGQAVYAGDTAWFRFNPAVSGQLLVKAESVEYDVVVILYATDRRPWGTTSIGDLTNVSCADQKTVGDELAGIQATDPSKTYYVQVGAKCASSTTCGAAVGGDTQVRLTFTPADSDGDGVPDTRDTCGGTAPGTPVDADGCADQDRDGIADSDDRCPAQAGVVSAGPFNGCPAGPTPPTGAADVDIVSLAGDPLNTNDPRVLLKLDWPPGTRQAFADNGVGDVPVLIDFERQPVLWTLPPTTRSEARQVNVRYVGPGVDVKVNDIITLDPVPPKLPGALVLPPIAGKYYVGLKMSDDPNGSGVASYTVLDKKGKALAKPVLCRRGGCETFQSSAAPKRLPAAVVVVDRAGNSRKFALKVTAESCRYFIPRKKQPASRKCFPPGSTCTDEDRRIYNFARARLVCGKANVVVSMGAP